MTSQDPARWFNDLSVYIDDRELIAETIRLLLKLGFTVER